MPGQQPWLAAWASFYVITSAAAATLLGLLFVVIAPDLVAAGMLLLLGLAIRNSWAMATAVVSSRG